MGNSLGITSIFEVFTALGISTRKKTHLRSILSLPLLEEWSQERNSWIRPCLRPAARLVDQARRRDAATQTSLENWHQTHRHKLSTSQRPHCFIAITHHRNCPLFFCAIYSELETTYRTDTCPLGLTEHYRLPTPSKISRVYHFPTFLSIR